MRSLGLLRIFNPTSRGAGTSRARALELLSKARAITIIYSHSDLAQARRLRRKVVGLRRNRTEASVFLDQDSLRPGERVSFDLIKAALEDSDVVVVVCGAMTARSAQVRRELDIALSLQAGKKSTLLPVILAPHIALPAGVDYGIQGIFLNHLFPGRVYLAWTLLGAFAILTGLALAAIRESERLRHVQAAIMLATRSHAIVDSDPRRALIVAVEATFHDPQLAVPAVEEAIRRALSGVGGVALGKPIVDA